MQINNKSKSLKESALAWASNASLYTCLDSCTKISDASQENPEINDLIIALRFDSKTLNVSSLSDMRAYLRDNEEHAWLFGYLSYELKNEIEDLESKKIDLIEIPVIQFFEADLVVKINGNDIDICFSREPGLTEKLLKDRIMATNYTVQTDNQVKLQARISKKEYISDIERMKYHIQMGDIYEANYCREYFAIDVNMDPLSVYLQLSEISPAPFSVFAKFGDHHVMSASPERFLKKVGNKVLSQPIKGTLKNSSDPLQNEKLKKQLFTSEKDRSENIMIVDLVRNDLSKIALKKSVKVDELCEIYSFTHLHHMISAVSCLIEEDTNPVDVIVSCFPMGSMTGAPKVRAMELIEELEHNKRGLYSGSIGYIKPNNDFDFNVVIRSIVYNENKSVMSAISGGAITIDSDPDAEYEESLLKLRAIFETLNANKEVLLN